MAIVGLLEYALETGRNHFITTAIEHKSVLEAMKYLQSRGCQVDFVYPDESGRVKASQILERVNEKTLLVSMMHVNSETGVIQPVEEVGEALAGTKTYFHIDATLWPAQFMCRYTQHIICLLYTSYLLVPMM